MDTKYIEEIRSKRAVAEENVAKAKEFVLSKEEEIQKVKERMLQASAVMDSESYLSLLKLVAEKEKELSGLKDIATAAENVKGYTDADVVCAFAKYCADYNPMIAEKLRIYNEKKAELFDLYYEMAELQDEAQMIRQECMEYLSGVCYLDRLTLIPEWDKFLAQYFFSRLTTQKESFTGLEA